MTNAPLRTTLCALPLTLLLGSAHGAQLKPFVLAYTASGTVSQLTDQVKSKLTDAGFTVVGSYSPYKGAEVIGVTSPDLKQAAAKSEYGAYGVVQRVTVTKSKDGIQVAYTNPVYMADAYHMKSDLGNVAAKLKQALGDRRTYGSEDGLSPSDLKGYHYMFGMPYFGDMDTLATYGSHQAALKAVKKGLAEKRGGVSEVYQVNIPERNETLFGVHMTKGCSGDQYIMSRVDFKQTKSTGHLPYGMLVDGDKVFTLAPKFRIAIDFPDLGMVGSNSFMSIMCAPNAIQGALTKAAGGKSG